MYTCGTKRCRQKQSNRAREEVTGSEAHQHQIQGRPVDPYLHRRQQTGPGGGWVNIEYNDGEAHISLTTGECPTCFKAEAEALQQTADEIRDNLSRTKFNMVIFTDAHSVLSKLRNLGQKDLNKVKTALVDFATQINLTAVDSSTLRDQRKRTDRHAC